MAKVFNGNMWAGIGNNITAQRAYKDKRAEDGFNGLWNVASGIEKMNANNNMRNAILDYYKQKQDASDIADAYDVEKQLAREQAIYDLANMDDSDLLETANEQEKQAYIDELNGLDEDEIRRRMQLMGNNGYGIWNSYLINSLLNKEA